jgi:hypothetical protein
MFKKSTDVLKKSTKPLMVISTIATLLIAAISSMPVMNSSASDYILISNDNNSGSIETHSLYNCDGEGTTCINENKNNDNNSGSIETHSLYNCVGKGKTCINTN